MTIPFFLLFAFPWMFLLGLDVVVWGGALLVVGLLVAGYWIVGCWLLVGLFVGRWYPCSIWLIDGHSFTWFTSMDLVSCLQAAYTIKLT